MNSTNARLVFYNGNQTPQGNSMPGILVIPTANGANAGVVKQLEREIDRALKQGVREGLWRPGDHVETPLGNTGRGAPHGEVHVIGDKITGYVQGVPMPATMLGLPFEDIDIDVYPGVAADGTRRVFADLSVYLVPDARLPY